MTIIFQGKILMGFGAGAGEEAHTLCTYLTVKRTDLGGLHVNCDRNRGSRCGAGTIGRTNVTFAELLIFSFLFIYFF